MRTGDEPKLVCQEFQNYKPRLFQGCLINICDYLDAQARGRISVSCRHLGSGTKQDDYDPDPHSPFLSLIELCGRRICRRFKWVLPLRFGPGVWSGLRRLAYRENVGEPTPNLRVNEAGVLQRDVHYKDLKKVGTTFWCDYYSK